MTEKVLGFKEKDAIPSLLINNKELEWVIKSLESAKEDWPDKISKLQLALVINKAIKDLKKIKEAKKEWLNYNIFCAYVLQ